MEGQAALAIGQAAPGEAGPAAAADAEASHPPRAPVVQAAPGGLPLLPLGGPPLRVLIADDSPFDRRLLQAILLRLHAVPELVADGEQAATMASTRDYDLVLMDILMPRLDGIAATRRIQALATRPPPRIVAVTGEPVLASRERCLGAGMADYLAKPLRVAQVEAVVRAAADARRP